MNRLPITACSIVLATCCALTSSPAHAESTFIEACFKTNDETHYITAHRDGNISAIVNQCRGYEVFEIEDVNGGALESGDPVYIKTTHGKYWTANPDGSLAARVEHKRGWERFQIIRDTNYYLTDDERICQGETFNLVSAHVLFVSARHEGGAEVRADGPTPRTWERLRLETEQDLCEDWSDRPVELVRMEDNSVAGYRMIGATAYDEIEPILMKKHDDVSYYEPSPGESPLRTRWNPATRMLRWKTRCASFETEGTLKMLMGLSECDVDDAKQRWTFDIRDGTLRPLSHPDYCATGRDAAELGKDISGVLDELGIDIGIDTSAEREIRYIDIEECDDAYTQRHWRLRY